MPASLHRIAPKVPTFLHSLVESIYDRSHAKLLIAYDLPPDPRWHINCSPPMALVQSGSASTQQTETEVALTINIGRAMPMGLTTRPVRPRKTTAGTRDTSGLLSSLA